MQDGLAKHTRAETRVRSKDAVEGVEKTLAGLEDLGVGRKRHDK